MSGLRQLLSLIRWDLLREVRRPVTLFNMTLLAVLILFAGRIGVEVFATPYVTDREVGLERQGIEVVRATHAFGPIFFWIAVLFAGTVGINQCFAAERKAGGLGGITTAPIDPSTFYLAKVVGTWVYTMTMQILLLGAYIVLFNDSMSSTWPIVLAATASFTIAYVAPGVVLAAMTTTLGGAGEVVLRILLFVIMIPLIMLTLDVSAALFEVPGSEHALRSTNFTLGPTQYLGIATCFGVIYLCVGYVLFPKVLEE